MKKLFTILLFLSSVHFAFASEIKGAESYNVSVFRDDETQVQTATFHDKWINYVDENGEFNPIDPTIEDCKDTFCVKKAPFEAYFPKTAAGVATFKNNNRFDTSTKERINEEDLDTFIAAQGVADVPGTIETSTIPTLGNMQVVRYKDAYPFGDLLYFVYQGTDPRLVKLIQFNRSIGQDTNIAFLISYSSSTRVSSQINGEKTDWDKSSSLILPKGKFLDVASQRGKRGASMMDARIWDSASSTKISGVDVTLSPQGNGFLYTKTIPISFLRDAVFPVYTDASLTVFPDPSSGATTVDGILNSNAVPAYVLAHDATVSSGAFMTDDSTNVAQNSFGGVNYTIWRSVYTLDTSALGSSATISAATFSLAGNGSAVTNGDSASLNIYTSSPAANNTLATSDYASSSFGTVGLATAITLAGWDATDGNYNTFNFNAGGIAAINTTGISKFGGRIVADATNNAPTGVNTVAAYFADHAGTTVDPKLTITYTVPPPTVRVLIQG